MMVYVFENTAPRELIITVPSGESWEWHEVQESYTKWNHPYLTLLREYDDGMGGTGSEVGPVGPAGQDGQDGLSAYEIAVKYGYTGTEEEFARDSNAASFLDSIKVWAGGSLSQRPTEEWQTRPDM